LHSNAINPPSIYIVLQGQIIIRNCKKQSDAALAAQTQDSMRTPAPACDKCGLANEAIGWTNIDFIRLMIYHPNTKYADARFSNEESLQPWNAVSNSTSKLEAGS
jgi:hypothetical protein